MKRLHEAVIISFMSIPGMIDDRSADSSLCDSFIYAQKKMKYVMGYTSRKNVGMKKSGTPSTHKPIHSTLYMAALYFEYFYFKIILSRKYVKFAF